MIVLLYQLIFILIDYFNRISQMCLNCIFLLRRAAIGELVGFSLSIIGLGGCLNLFLLILCLRSICTVAILVSWFHLLIMLTHLDLSCHCLLLAH